MDDDLAARAHAASAIEAFARGDIDTATTELEEAVRLAPHDAVHATNLGHAYRAAGELERAVDAYRHATRIDGSASAWMGLGDVLHRLSDDAGAIDAYARAIDLGERSAALENALGVALKNDGRLEEADAAYARALAILEGDASEEAAKTRAAVWVNRGNALGDRGAFRDAVAAYEEALRFAPDSPEAHFNLYASVFDVDPARGEAALRHALESRPSFTAARLELGARCALRGDTREASELLRDAPPHFESSVAFVREAMQRAPEAPPRVFADGLRLLEHALSLAEHGESIIELGVRWGTSIRFLAARVEPRIVHGFDSFEGLPTAWGALPKGAYSTGGVLPRVPPNVVLHRGWFKDTLPPFVCTEPLPIRFLHVDCDLYGSTRDGFEALGPFVTEGTVIVFDEYLANPDWENEEHRALVEAAARFDFSYRYVGFSLFGKQAAVVVTAAKRGKKV